MRSRGCPSTNRSIGWRGTGSRSRTAAEQLGVHPKILRNWVRQAVIDGNIRPSTTTAEAQRIAQLEQENRELRRADYIMKTSAAFFAAGFDRPTTK